MRKLVLLFAVVGAFFVVPQSALAGPCGLPDTKPLWADYVDFPYAYLWAKPGLVAAVSDTVWPAKLRAGGAVTPRMDLYLNYRVGTPAAPLDPDTVVARAKKLMDAVVPQTGCANPIVVENELHGANAPTPWSETNERYRANVLLFLRTLAQLGAHPVLLLTNNPYVGSDEAAQWWRDVAAVSDIVREDYVPADLAWQRGALLANRTLRITYRRGVTDLISVGVPASRLGIMISFSTVKGFGGRNGLQPTVAWLDVTKWYALSARAVAQELGLGSIWTWGWRWWRPEEQDPDKAKAACVWLWVRDPHLCNAPKVAGKKFDRSLTEGQIRLRGNVQCRIGDANITTSAVAHLQVVSGDKNLALSALLARLVLARNVKLARGAVAAAERAVIAQRFGGNRGAYVRALVSAHVGINLAHDILADELRKAAVERHLRARRPAAADVRAFYSSYGDVLARPVRVKPAPLWLNARPRGIALSSIAPPAVFTIPTGRSVTVRGLDGTYRVKALAPAAPLASFPFSAVAGGISAALATATRDDAFVAWLQPREQEALRTAVCRRDELPPVGAGELTPVAPFLELAP